MFDRFSTINAWFSGDQVTIIVLINQEDLSAFTALDQIQNILLGKEAKQP